MTAHMQISSPELLRQHEEHKARRARMAVPAVPAKPAHQPPSRPQPDHVAHCWAWRRHCALIMDPPRPVDLDVLIADEGRKTGKHMMLGDHARLPRLSDILSICAAHYGLTLTEIRSDRRSTRETRPRQVAMYLARHMTERSLPEIGRIIGRRDHTTVLHGIRRIERLILTDADLAADVVAIRHAVEARRA